MIRPRPTTCPTTPRSLRRFAKYLRNGVAFGYPPCCILAFSIVGTWGRRPPPEVLGARLDRGRFIPCGVLHRPHVTAAAIREERAR